jgi:hypothetical protein
VSLNDQAARACGLCEGDADGRYLCERDVVALARRLGVLPDLDAELTMHLVPARTGPAELVTARTAGPRSPINEAVFDEIRDNRVGEVVHSWRVDVQRERWPQHAAPPRGGLAADCRWLAMELEWIASSYPAAGELAREVRELEAQRGRSSGTRCRAAGGSGCASRPTDVRGGVRGGRSRLPGETVLVCRWCRTACTRPGVLTLARHHQPSANP